MVFDTSILGDSSDCYFIDIDRIFAILEFLDDLRNAVPVRSRTVLVRRFATAQPDDDSLPVPFREFGVVTRMCFDFRAVSFGD